MGGYDVSGSLASSVVNPTGSAAGSAHGGARRRSWGWPLLLSSRGRHRLVGSRIDGDQLDVEIPEDLEGAEEPGLIRDPPDQRRLPVLDAADFEPLDGRDQGLAQGPFDLDLDRSCAQRDSFR
jgi:hypothetical protein